MNEHSHMIVTLLWQGAATDESEDGGLVEYPCIVTLASDFNGDFRVDSRDVAMLGAANGTSTAMFDLNADLIVDSLDLAWLLGDYTGDALCDLHSRFPCPPEEEEPGGEMMLSGEQLAASAEVSAGSVANAVAALGFPSVDAYLTWCVEADPEAAENVLLTVWTLHTQSQWGGEQ